MMKYSDDYLPSAPVARVTIRNPETNESISDVAMLLDTGADITILPRAICEQIGLSSDSQEEVQGFDGRISNVEVVQASLIFHNKLFQGRFFLYDSEEGILGRDVSNAFTILLDGPNSEWEVVDPVTRRDNS